MDNYSEQEVGMTAYISDSALFFKRRISEQLEGIMGNCVDENFLSGTDSFMKHSDISLQSLQCPSREHDTTTFADVYFCSPNPYYLRHKTYCERHCPLLQINASFHECRSARAKSTWAVHIRPEICSAVSHFAQIKENMFRKFRHQKNQQSHPLHRTNSWHQAQVHKHERSQPSDPRILRRSIRKEPWPDLPVRLHCSTGWQTRQLSHSILFKRKEQASCTICSRCWTILTCSCFRLHVHHSPVNVRFLLTNTSLWKSSQTPTHSSPPWPKQHHWTKTALWLIILVSDVYNIGFLHIQYNAADALTKTKNSNTLQSLIHNECDFPI